MMDQSLELTGHWPSRWPMSPFLWIFRKADYDSAENGEAELSRYVHAFVLKGEDGAGDSDGDYNSGQSSVSPSTVI